MSQTCLPPVSLLSDILTKPTSPALGQSLGNHRLTEVAVSSALASVTQEMF